MEEIVISKWELLNLINKTSSYAEMAVELQILASVSPSIDEIKRQAFEAGRERDFNENKMGDYKYETFEDYNQSLRHKDNGNKGE